MICNNTKELLAEIKKYMILNNIHTKELAVNMGKKDSQSVSQIFTNGNPNCNTLFNILDGLNVSLDVNFVSKSDTK